MALETGTCEYHFVRRYLERQSATAVKSAPGRSTHPPAHVVSRPHRTAEPKTSRREPTMNIIELERSLRQLRLGGMAAVLETRLRQAQAEPMAPIDLISCLVSDELTRRSDRLLDRRRKQAGFRDPDRTLDNFDFSFNPENQSQSGLRSCHRHFHQQARRRSVSRSRRNRQEPLGAGHRSGRDPARLQSAVSRNTRPAGRTGRGRRRWHSQASIWKSVSTVPLLIIDDFGMRKLPHTAAEDLLEIIMRRYERCQHSADFQSPS